MVLAVYQDGGVQYDGSGAHTLSTDVWYFLVLEPFGATGLAVYVHDVLDDDVSASHTRDTTAVAV